MASPDLHVQPRPGRPTQTTALGSDTTDGRDAVHRWDHPVRTSPATGGFMDSRQRRRLLAGAISLAAAGAFTSASTGHAPVATTAVHPAVAEFTQLTTSETPPTIAQCV